jgi:hypothetical protein
VILVLNHKTIVVPVFVMKSVLEKQCNAPVRVKLRKATHADKTVRQAIT